ncbi:Plasmodium exported protein, unknown function [Plasmodium vivax]|uniref:Pv-fam-d protein n=1 Tax=Plasmodium vivax TaxID=5855 RepID=A0A1G4HLN0_PLAVI|nr:Plasmodium exported protein, unknown function [Plasmodium vivax]
MKMKKNKFSSLIRTFNITLLLFTYLCSYEFSTFSKCSNNKINTNNVLGLRSSRLLRGKKYVQNSFAYNHNVNENLLKINSNKIETHYNAVFPDHISTKQDDKCKYAHNFDNSYDDIKYDCNSKEELNRNYYDEDKFEEFESSKNDLHFYEQSNRHKQNKHFVNQNNTRNDFDYDDYDDDDSDSYSSKYLYRKAKGQIKKYNKLEGQNKFLIEKLLAKDNIIEKENKKSSNNPIVKYFKKIDAKLEREILKAYSYNILNDETEDVLSISSVEKKLFWGKVKIITPFIVIGIFIIIFSLMNYTKLVIILSLLCVMSLKYFFSKLNKCECLLNSYQRTDEDHKKTKKRPRN